MTEVSKDEQGVVIALSLLDDEKNKIQTKVLVRSALKIERKGMVLIFS